MNTQNTEIKKLQSDFEIMIQAIQNLQIAINTLRTEQIRFLLTDDYIFDKLNFDKESFLVWAEQRWNDIQAEIMKEEEQARQEVLKQLASPIQLG